jgi:hypothetical protein
VFLAYFSNNLRHVFFGLGQLLQLLFLKPTSRQDCSAPVSSVYAFRDQPPQEVLVGIFGKDKVLCKQVAAELYYGNIGNYVYNIGGRHQGTTTTTTTSDNKGWGDCL